MLNAIVFLKEAGCQHSLKKDVWLPDLHTGRLAQAGLFQKLNVFHLHHLTTCQALD